MSWKFKSSDADGFVCEDTTSPIRVCDVYDSRGRDSEKHVSLKLDQ